MGYKVVITTNTGDEITADDSVVERQGTAAYNQICNKRDVLIKDSDDNAVFVPFVNVVKADVSVLDAPAPGPGPGPIPVEEKYVNFIDYDGTIVASYTAEEFAELSELPENPSHDGLVAQGWNWSLADAQAYVAAHGMLAIGQTYITDDGKTRINISIPADATGDQLNFHLYFNATVVGGVTIDWGDSSATESNDSTNDTHYKHTYAAAGDYTITITVSDGYLRLTDQLYTPNNEAFWYGSDNDEDDPYGNYYKRQTYTRGMYIGSRFKIDPRMFEGNSLKYLTIPIGAYNAATTVSDEDGYRYRTFAYSSMLDALSLPNDWGEIYEQDLESCNFRYVSIPNGITKIGAYGFNGDTRLEYLSIPDTVTGIGANQFGNDKHLKRITGPSTMHITYDNEGAFFEGCFLLEDVDFLDSLEFRGDSKAFYNCISLKGDIHVADGVTDTYQQTFENCGSVNIYIPSSVTAINYGDFTLDANIYMFPTTPPNGVLAPGLDKHIYVPYSADHSVLAAYRASNTWGHYADQIVEMEEEGE